MDEADVQPADISPTIFNSSYEMPPWHSGKALIFNNETFVNWPPREGTDKDRDELKTILERFDFSVDVHSNLKAEDIRTVLTDASNSDYEGKTVFLCVFLTHGDDGIIYGSDEENLELKNVFDMFRANKCETLIGKPKIFIIQACRGGSGDTSVQVGGAPTVTVRPEYGVKLTIPTEADFLVCYSSSEGFYSIREPARGSWYIQDLTRVLKEFGHDEDFIQLLTVVNRLVSERTIEGPGHPNLQGKKQMPCFLSKLTRQLRLTDRDRSPLFVSEESVNF